jgi:hypothetical protein
MNEKAQDAALLLLAATQQIIAKRRQMEMVCTWPPEYGGDELLLKRIQEFLEQKEIKYQLDEVLEEIAWRKK